MVPVILGFTSLKRAVNNSFNGSFALMIYQYCTSSIVVRSSISSVSHLSLTCPSFVDNRASTQRSLSSSFTHTARSLTPEGTPSPRFSSAQASAAARNEATSARGRIAIIQGYVYGNIARTRSIRSWDSVRLSWGLSGRWRNRIRMTSMMGSRALLILTRKMNATNQAWHFK